MTAPSQSLFLTNPQTQANYGAVLSHYEGRMSSYTAVFVMSEREYGIINDRKIDMATSTPEQMRAAVREMYPDRPVDVLFPNDADIRAFMQAATNGEKPEPGKKPTVAPGAGSVQVGNPGETMRIGLLALPQNMNLVPEDLGYIAADQRRNPTSGPVHEQRVRDTATMVVSHELHHLLEAASENSFSQSALPGAIIRNSSQGGETYADRGMLADLPGLVQAGLISNSAIASDYIAGRQIATYGNIVEARPVSHYNSDTGQTTQRIPLKDHDTGFSLTSGDTMAAQESNRRETGTQVNSLYRSGLNQMYAQAGEGRASPETNAIYQNAMRQVDRDLAASEANAARINGKPSGPKTQQQLDDEEKIRREAFDQAMINSPNFKREMAQQIVRMPNADTGAVRMAGEYAMAHDRLIAPKDGALKETGETLVAKSAHVLPVKPMT